MKSETPRTDAMVQVGPADLQSGTMDLVSAEFARDLERELTTAKVHCADANKGARINAMVNTSLTKKVIELERERNDLRYEESALCVNLLYLLHTGATKEQLESRIDSARTKIRAAAMLNVPN